MAKDKQPTAPRKRRKPLGHPILWTQEQLRQLSEITEEDIRDARRFWKQTAPVRYKNLIDATPLEEESE